LAMPVSPSVWATAMNTQRSQMMRAELRAFWTESSRLNQLRRAGGLSHQEVQEFRDEAGAIAMHSDWSRLRTVAAARLAEAGTFAKGQRGVA
jgi:hypothetical protein